MDIDFTVYAQRLIPFIDGHSRRAQRAYGIIDEHTSLVVPGSVRRRLASIADLRWLKIYDSVNTCRRIAAYGMSPLEADHYFVVKYGDESTHGWLTSSRLLVLHRVTAEVYYAGPAGDEG